MKNIFLILITFLFAPIFYLIIILNKYKRKKSQLRILVIDTGKIGDLVCTTPVFREIKKNFINSRLTVIIREQSYGVVQDNPHIDEFVFLNNQRYKGVWEKIKFIKKIIKGKFYYSINLSPYAFNSVLSFWAGIPKRITSISKFTGKTARLFSIFNNFKLEYKRHTSKLIHNLELLRFMGVKDYSDKKEVFSNSEEEKVVNDFLKNKGFKNDDFLIGISVTAGNKIKEWEPEKFTQLADKLINKLKAKIIFIGTLNDKIILDSIKNNMINRAVVADNFKLNELAAFLKKLKLFISVDTGPLYIAHAVGIPVVDIVGPCDIDEQPPQDNNSELIYNKIDCWPCSFVIPPARICKNGHLRCLRDITPIMVYEAIIKLMKKNNYAIK